jgi:hypothetical protein
MSKAGSLFRARYRDRYFALVSAHQIRFDKYGYEQLCLINDARKTLVSSHRAIFPSGPDADESDFDCMLFEFTDVVASGALSRHNWYDLTEEMEWDQTPKPSLVCAIGYPGYRNHIYYENWCYGVSPNIVWGKECLPKIGDRLAFSPNPEISFEPKGMSGGPVFCIRLNASDPEAFFAGILTNASKSLFHFLPLVRLKHLVRDLFSGAPQS